jgi:diguanylate cyclase (GGDEF)-like protein
MGEKRDAPGGQPGEITHKATPASTESSEGAKRPYLIIIAGSRIGEMHKLANARTVIGRGDTADIRIVDDGLSREHVEILLEGDKVLVRDLQSTNGTFANWKRVQEAELADGDKVSIGSTTILKFTYQDGMAEEFERSLYLSATSDALTKCLRKEFFLDRLESEVAYSLRHGTPVSLLFWDIDRFKAVNDRHGPQAGDLVLAEMARVVAASIRREDLFARHGGEEFALACRGVTADVARAVAERLRAAIAGTVVAAGRLSLQVTASFGVAVCPGAGIAGATELVAAADAAMVRAKALGRNRVVVHGKF